MFYTSVKCQAGDSVLIGEKTGALTDGLTDMAVGVLSGVNAVISGAGVKTGAYTGDGVNDGVLIDEYGVVGVGILQGTLTGVNTSKWVTARMPRQEK